MAMLLNELMLNILFGVSFALIKHYDQHANREGKGLFGLHIVKQGWKPRFRR